MLSTLMIGMLFIIFLFFLLGIVITVGWCGAVVVWQSHANFFGQVIHFYAKQSPRFWYTKGDFFGSLLHWIYVVHVFGYLYKSLIFIKTNQGF